jgi:ADP-heptose:LPS heptosyltransferase
VTVIGRTDPVPPFDARAPIPSLPGRLGTTLDTIPARVPYLHATPEAVAAWQSRTASLNHPRVGLCWSGSSTHERDAVRSVRFAEFKKIVATGNHAFVSLQRDSRPDEKVEIAAETRLADFTAHLSDFNETAALIQSLDLVITVDTSIAHLAGALAKPVWILLAYAPDWRWLWDRNDSPWYPTARLYRQTRYGDWSDVLERLSAELAKFKGLSSRP